MPKTTHCRPIVALLLALAALTTSACRSTESTSASPGALEDVTVEAACGQCQFGLPGDSCDLAVRVDGVAYFVNGTGIDDHGDAHATDGFCNTVRHATVSGRIEDDRFVATSFVLLPDD